MIAVVSLASAYGFYRSFKLLRHLNSQCASLQNAVDCLGYDLVDDPDENECETSPVTPKAPMTPKAPIAPAMIAPAMIAPAMIAPAPVFSQCSEIIKSGKKKGQPCGRLCEGDKCNLHNKIRESLETIQESNLGLTEVPLDD